MLSVLNSVCTAHLHYASYLLHFTLSREEGIACVEFSKDAAQTPHVNGHAVGVTQDDLRRAIETTLDVGVNCGKDRGEGVKIIGTDINVGNVNVVTKIVCSQCVEFFNVVDYAVFLIQLSEI